MTNNIFDTCSQQFTNENSLKHHIESVHEKIKHSCSKCDHKAGTKNSLKPHIKGVHKKIKYSCEQCEYKATTKGSLYQWSS